MWNRFFDTIQSRPTPASRIELPQGVINGECAKVMSSLPSASVDLIVTDPPYVVNFKKRDGNHAFPNDDNDRWIAPAFKEAFRLLKEDTFCVSFYGWWKVDSFMRAWTLAGFRPVGHIVWLKQYRSNSNYLNYYHEQAYLLAKGRPKARKVLNDVQEWNYSGNELHPTQKAAAILRPLIEAYSDEGQLVLDPFCGSGSTLEAAKTAGRRYLGIELVRDFAVKAAERLKGEPERQREGWQVL